MTMYSCIVCIYIVRWRSYDTVHVGVCGGVLIKYNHGGQRVYPNSIYPSICDGQGVCPNDIYLMKEENYSYMYINVNV